MNFVDVAQVTVKAGDGGDGRVSFRHEKFIDKGGPDGGDGGDGGAVTFVASRNQNTLVSFRFQKELAAQNGQAGGQSNKHGRNGKPLVVKVPVGTVVVNGDGQIIADLTTDEQAAVIAVGGKGGFGNAHFLSSRRQAPKIAESGEKRPAITVKLELKTIADVGLVGLPNAGKSTFLSVVSNAKPEIADYPFTTLTPNLGVAAVDETTSLLLADIPGLIEGAAQGKGLGDAFLKHIERTAVLLHLIDVYHEDVAAAYTTIQNELAAYQVNLTDRAQIVLLNKVDGMPEAVVAEKLATLRTVVPKDVTIMPISAQAKQGLKEVLYATNKLVQAYRIKRDIVAAETNDALPVLKLTNTEEAWRLSRADDGRYVITGSKIEKFASRTDLENEHSLGRLRDIMKRMGIVHELKRQRVEAGSIIVIGDLQFNW